MNVERLYGKGGQKKSPLPGLVKGFLGGRENEVWLEVNWQRVSLFGLWLAISQPFGLSDPNGQSRYKSMIPQDRKQILCHKWLNVNLSLSHQG